MKVLVLAAGGYVSDPSRGEYPLFLSEVDGSLLIERLIAACQTMAPREFIFFVRREDIAAYHIDEILQQIVPGCQVIVIKAETMGAACTALLAIDHIEPDEELVVVNATDYIDSDLGEIVSAFHHNRADAGTVVFDGLHPRYSFVRLDEQNRVIEAAEKRPISRNAIAGMFWFARGGEFVAALQAMIAKDVQLNGRFYICPCLNELVLRRKKISTWRIQPHSYHPFKSTQQVNNFESVLEHMRAIHATQSP